MLKGDLFRCSVLLTAADLGLDSGAGFTAFAAVELTLGDNKRRVRFKG
jgi:hypothetical protein